MKSQNITSSSKLDYFSEILNTSNTGSSDIVFCNLIRGTSYKLKVFIESTQGDKLNRTSSSIIIENYTSTDGSTQQIIAKKSFSPLCVSYRFDTRPGVQTTNPLLWYWQQKFASSGYYETGCINAVDQYGTEIPGLPSIKDEINCGRRNCRFIDYNSYLVNQTSLNVSETYTICAYPLSTCRTDPSNYEEVLNDIMSSLPNNQTFKEVLDVLVVPNFKLTQVMIQMFLKDQFSQMLYIQEMLLPSKLLPQTPFHVLLKFLEILHLLLLKPILKLVDQIVL